MISIDGLAVEFGGTTLFSDISFVINEKDRIASWERTEPEKVHYLKYSPECGSPPAAKSPHRKIVSSPICPSI